MTQRSESRHSAGGRQGPASGTPGRRALLGAGLASITLGGLGSPALAQGVAWPSRSVRLIVAYPAGGSTDIVARLLAERLSRIWNQPVVVDNRAGAAGTIGADSVAKTTPDGYTLLLAASPEIAIARSTLRNLPYDPVRDFAPINLLAQSPFLLMATPGINVSSLQELVALARARPGTLNYASFGTGTSNHFVGELFKVSAGIDITHVPYRGSGPMMTDLIGGTVQLAFDTIPAGLPHVQAGRLRGIGAAMLRRSSLAPDIPTLDEQGLQGFTGGSWVGLVAPARTPEPVVEKIAADVDRVMADGFSRELAQRGLAPEGLGPAAFRSFIEAEVVKWGDVARRAGIAAS
jgi:tripartite-type tricarboxylate transporter receptor subunit TctC